MAVVVHLMIGEVETDFPRVRAALVEPVLREFQAFFLHLVGKLILIEEVLLADLPVCGQMWLVAENKYRFNNILFFLWFRSPMPKNGTLR